jgi:carotenoid cleavage dioxygenase-like enzyme
MNQSTKDEIKGRPRIRTPRLSIAGLALHGREAYDGHEQEVQSEIPANLSMTDNYFISQNSETELTKLQVDGSLPKWLNGKPVRNGPAIFEAGS